MRRLFLVGLLLLASITAASAQPDMTIRSLKVLAVIYRGAPGDKACLSDERVQAVKNGVEFGRLFYFRNTRCRLNCEMTYLIVDQSAPKNDGPTYDYITEDLKIRGVKDNQYDGIFCTGIGFTGNWGGFRVFGRTGACFGSAGKDETFSACPADDPNVSYGTGWIFIHEFEHALDGVICNESGHPELLSDHPYSDSSADYFSYGHHAAQHWDWVAHCLSSFTDYMDVPGATDSTITTADKDGDGFPDDDPRLPMDEKRFGSDPTMKDTDNDGLDDLAEFSADIYRGSDPRNPDTDGDGIPDGIDKNPTVPLAETISYSDQGPEIDGKLDSCYHPFTLGTYVDNSPALAQARMSACWNEDALYLFVKTHDKCSIDFQIDTSADNGFWEGGDTYEIKAGPDGKVVFSGLGRSGEVPGAKAAWGTDGLEIMVPVMIGQGVSNEANFGGKRRPEDTTDGMVLLSGRNISFNIVLSDDTGKALITPNWSMFDITPVKSVSDQLRPSLRFTKTLTRDLQPTVEVSGVGPQIAVTIVDQKGKMVGERIGDGAVILTGKLKVGRDSASGANTLRAVAGGRESTPVTVVIDREAKTPTFKLSADGKSYQITGEPGASVDIYSGVGSSPVWGIATIHLNDKGVGEFKEPSGNGFIGSYGHGTSFDRPVFSRIDPEINNEYQDGTCDPRLPADGFCVRWTGYAEVSTPGDYTFYLSSDDGSKLWVDGVQVADNWGHHDKTEKTANVRLTKGEHQVRVDYYEEYGWASAHLEWSGPVIARTHAIPVKPLPSTIGEVTYFARQTDAAGNVSAFGKL